MTEEERKETIKWLKIHASQGVIMNNVDISNCLKDIAEKLK
jgi:ribosome recycling factor